MKGRGRLDGADVVITDFGATGPLHGTSPLTVCRNGDSKPDAFKGQGYFPPSGHPATEEGQACHPGMDLYALGELLRVFASLADGPCPWLEKAAQACQHDDPTRRPRAADLLSRLSPDWDDHLRLLRDTGNWRPEDHEGFVGRSFVIEYEFERFVRACDGRGGVFVVEGPAGIGKSAVLTRWADLTGRPFGYYFRYRDNMTQADAMPRRSPPSFATPTRSPTPSLKCAPVDRLRRTSLPEWSPTDRTGRAA